MGAAACADVLAQAWYGYLALLKLPPDVSNGA
jgi:hypothetical protein